jgi:hypothetical protein
MGLRYELGNNESWESEDIRSSKGIAILRLHYFI